MKATTIPFMATDRPCYTMVSIIQIKDAQNWARSFHATVDLDRLIIIIKKMPDCHTTSYIVAIEANALAQ